MRKVRYLLGQVGGFPLRLSWLPRAYQRYSAAQKIPNDPADVAVDLGIGKSMAKSLRIWALATGVLGEAGSFNPLAKKLFGHDPYLEQVDSIALLHWLICSNLARMTANAWLFNYFSVGQFTIKQAVASFREYLMTSEASYAEGTVRVDIETALRMYTSVHDRSSFDMDDKFFYPLGLFTVRRIDGKPTFARTWETERPLISRKVLSYAVVRTLSARKVNSSPVSDLYASSFQHSSPGVVFGFTNEGFFAALEDLVQSGAKKFAMTSLPGGDFEFTAKAGLGQRCKKGDASCADDAYFGKS